MITRCPYPECRHEFPIEHQLPEGDWHWKLGECPACRRPASLRPIEMMESIERMFEKRERLGALSGGGGEVSEPALSVLVEDVRSLWNVGAIFRTGDGAGFSSLVLCGITGSPPRKEIAKTSLGAEDFVPWRYRRGAVEPLREMRQKGVLVVGLERCSASVPLSEAIAQEKLSAPLCLVLGNEVMGVSAEALSFCDLVCHLPMRGKKQSLNVAVAFGIAAYQIAEALAPPGR